MTPSILSLLFAFLAPAVSHAGIEQETLFFDGVPSPGQIETWSKLPGSYHYLIKMDAPAAWNLEALERLQNAASLGLEITTFPGEDTVGAWASLAAAVPNVGMISLGAGIPTLPEIERLNRSGVTSYTFVQTGYSSAAEYSRLAALEGGVSVTYVVRQYPRFMDREALLAIPEDVPLLFVTDYWPWYSHMDLFNLIPHGIHLRVRGSFPPEGSLPYLRNIERLRSVAVETDFEPAEGTREWSRFGSLPATWICRDFLPSDGAARGFGRSGRDGARRNLVIDREWPLQPEQREFLDSLPLPVRLIRSAPYGFLK